MRQPKINHHRVFNYHHNLRSDIKILDERKCSFAAGGVAAQLHGLGVEPGSRACRIGRSPAIMGGATVVAFDPDLL
jgi:hypothetical protein